MRQFCLILTLTILSTVAFSQQSSGTVHTYYVAADEVEWNYLPLGIDGMMHMPLTGYPALFVERGPHRIGATYRKAIYRECTDATFTTLKPRPPEWEHLGAIGPVLRAEVGDTIHVVFKNNASRPYTMHPHGVFYEKESEGASYADGTNFPDKNGVPPGRHTRTYGKCPSAPGPAPVIPAPSYGFTTHTPMSPRTSRLD